MPERIHYEAAIQWRIQCDNRTYPAGCLALKIRRYQKGGDHSTHTVSHEIERRFWIDGYDPIHQCLQFVRRRRYAVTRIAVGIFGHENIARRVRPVGVSGLIRAVSISARITEKNEPGPVG